VAVAIMDILSDGEQAALAAVHIFDRTVPPDVDDQADGHRAHDRLVTGDFGLP
jgi:hypothetical protein